MNEVVAVRTARERLLRPTLRELWTFLAIALPVLAALLATMPSVDLAYQLRAGAEILVGQGIPSQDTWTFTAAGLPWLDQQWGAQVVLAAIYAASGWTGLAILRAALVGLVSGLILAAIRARALGMHPRTAALLSLAAFVVMAPALALRPQLLGMALFALTLLILAARRTQPRIMWLLPAVAVAWANVHGSFFLGPVLVGLAWLEDAAGRAPGARRTFLAALAMAGATFVTPFGVGVWRYALGLAMNRQVTAQISEWQPPSFSDVPGLLFWSSVVLAILGSVWLARRPGRTAWPALLGLIAFAGLGAITGRGIAWWPGVAVVTLAGLAGRPAAAASSDAVDRPVRPTPIRRGNRVNAGIGLALVLTGLALLPAWRPLDPALGAPSGLLGQAPSGITGALRSIATSSDRVWNPQVWGSWLEFAVPIPLYAFDARIEVIPSDAWAQHGLVERAQAGWSDVLDVAGVTIVVTDGSPATPLAEALAGSQHWRPAHADNDGGIWVRSER